MNELQEFLEQNPHLIPMQRKIEDRLRGRTQEERFIILAQLIVDNLDELTTEVKLLESIIDNK